MKKFIAAIGLVALLFAAGCGNAAKVASTPQAKQAEQIVQGCLSKGNPAAIKRCIAPPGHSAALERCALHAVTHDFLRHVKLVEALVKCVEEDR